MSVAEEHWAKGHNPHGGHSPTGERRCQGSRVEERQERTLGSVAETDSGVYPHRRPEKHTTRKLVSSNNFYKLHRDHK